MSESKIPEKIEPGDWFVADTEPYCVLASLSDDRFLVVNGRHCVSEIRNIGLKTIKGGPHNDPWEYVGRGKKRWYWRFLPWRDLVSPFTKPESLWFV